MLVISPHKPPQQSCYAMLRSSNEAKINLQQAIQNLKAIQKIKNVSSASEDLTSVPHWQK